jgi:hypothetical protein
MGQEVEVSWKLTYQQLAQYTNHEYEHKEWPLIPNSDRPVWESLLLIRDREFHNDFKPRGFSWLTPSVNQINWQLAPRDGLKNPTKTLFQRFGILDEDGSEIRLHSPVTCLVVHECGTRRNG